MSSQAHMHTADSRKLTFGFKITVNEAHKVEILQSGCNLGRIEPGSVFGKALARSALQGPEKFTTHAVFHAEIQVLVGLE